MNFFFSTGEASGELAAVELARAIRIHHPQARFEGIGGNRMREAGFTLWQDHKGWASMGPFEAIPRIPKLFIAGMQLARHIVRTKPDLVVLVDFGAFNLRLAQLLRERYRYEGPILDWFPPGTWLDSERSARKVASMTVPLTAFAHQYEFYKQLQLPAVYFGHPLAARYTMRPSRPAPPSDGGHIALLPGSRPGEIRRHLPVLQKSAELLKIRRPHLTVTAGLPLQEAIADADAAFVASGTAVLETVLSGVPTIGFYILSPILVPYARRVFRGGFVTIPNLVMQHEIVPELLQTDATPENLAQRMDELLREPAHQYEQFTDIRKALGPEDALEKSAKFALALAKAGATQ